MLDAPMVGVERIGPFGTFDHAIVVVSDLDDAARAFERDFGLVPTSGGIHPGVGTGNRIIPIAGGYVELMGIVDKDLAVDSWLGKKVLEALDQGQALMDWAMRSPSVDRLRTTLAQDGWHLSDSMPGSREVAGGGTLAWVVQHLGDSEAYLSGMPFYIEWVGLEPPHPSAVSPQPNMPRLSRLRIGLDSDAAADRIRAVSGSTPLELVVGERAGVDAVVLEIEGHEVTVARSWGLR